ncbi:MAG: hypothetical protein H6812_00735 [Phycisphaeraceae bacterium]|nr:hypothetical protein [Phycisphaerales bacterium]MCA9287980.1 hypothetical protein [Phycisphaerales bacterium]MCA9305977.1 hypothetical protein [Phycisphaerales bacterium]MCB9841762.1 hypothetical protein [Phycisphaeraceae bacterium]
MPEPSSRTPRKAKPDYDAARAAGAKPFLITLHKAHRLLAKALIAWTVLFILSVALYHALGKPKALDDRMSVIFVAIFGVLWAGSLLAIFLSNFVVRRLRFGAFVGLPLHGFMLLFPIVNVIAVQGLAPELPGQHDPIAHPHPGPA